MIEKEIKELIIERYGTLAAFTEKIGLPYSTLNSILKSDIGKANLKNVMLICEELQISIDALRHNRIVPSVTYKGLSRKDLARQLKYLIDDADGLSDKKKQYLLSTIELTCDDDDSQ